MRRMRASSEDRKYREALAYLDAQLSKPKPEIQRWLNDIVDQWIASRRAAKRRKRRHV